MAVGDLAAEDRRCTRTATRPRRAAPARSRLAQADRAATEPSVTPSSRGSTVPLGRTAQGLERAPGCCQIQPGSSPATPAATAGPAPAAAASIAAPSASPTPASAALRPHGSRTRGSAPGGRRQNSCCDGRTTCSCPGQACRTRRGHFGPFASVAPESRAHAAGNFDARDTWSAKSLAILPRFSYLGILL